MAGSGKATETSPFDWIVHRDTAVSGDVRELLALGRVAQSLLDRNRWPDQGRYEVVRRLGRGSFGTVLLARDPQLQREVAVKVVALPRDATPADDAAARRAAATRKRVFREAQALAALTHAHVVPVYDVGLVDAGFPRMFIVMQYLRGGSLREWLQAPGHRSATEILSMFDRVASGLAAMHAADLVHRDVKPDNVVLSDEGEPKLVDLGLAARVRSPLDDSSEDETEPMQVVGASADGHEPMESTAASRTAGIVGTPHYMAPEQHEGTAPTPASDQFALAVSIYEALGGVRPFVAADVHELRDRKLKGRLTRPPIAIDRRVLAVLRRAMSVDPSDRFESVEAMRTALRRAARPRRRTTGRAVAIGAALSLPTLGLFVLAGDEPSPHACVQGPLWADSAPALERELASGTAADLEAWARLSESLSTYAESWARAQQRVCEHDPSADPGTQSRRIECLERIAVQARAWRTAVDPQDAHSAEQAQRMLATLPPPAACADASDDLAGQSPQQRRTVAGLEHELALIAAHIGVDADATTVADAQEVLTKARRTEHLPLIAHALDVTGRAQLDLGAYVEADSLLTESVWAAMNADRPARAAMTMIKVLYARQHGAGPDAVDELVPQAHRLIQEADAPPRLRAALASTLAYHAASRGRFDEAQEGFRDVQQMLARVGETQTSVYGESLAGMAYIASRRGDLDEALSLAQAAVAVLVRADGEYARSTAMANDRLGGIHHRRGELEQARAAYERSIEILETRFGPEHPDLAWPRSTLAMVWRAEGRLDEAAEASAKALEIAERALSDDNEVLAAISFNRSMILESRGELDEAVALVRRAREIKSKISGPESADVGRADRRLGRLLLEMEDAEAAVVPLRSAREALMRHDQVVDAAECSFMLAKALDALGQRDAANREARIALAGLPVEEEAPRAEVRQFLARD